MAMEPYRFWTVGVPRISARWIPALRSSNVLFLTCSVMTHGQWLLFCFSEKDIERMITHGRQVRCLWVYAPESEPCSAFNGIMWELQRKVRQFHQSAETFWLHNGSIVNRNLVEFSHWKPPMPLPWACRCCCWSKLTFNFFILEAAGKRGVWKCGAILCCYTYSIFFSNLNWMSCIEIKHTHCTLRQSNLNGTSTCNFFVAISWFTPPRFPSTWFLHDFGRLSLSLQHLQIEKQNFCREYTAKKRTKTMQIPNWLHSKLLEVIYKWVQGRPPGLVHEQFFQVQLLSNCFFWDCFEHCLKSRLRWM